MIQKLVFSSVIFALPVVFIASGFLYRRLSFLEPKEKHTNDYDQEDEEDESGIIWF